MTKDEYLRRTLRDFAESRGPVRIDDILDADEGGCGYKAQEIIDECTMLVADCQDRNSVAAVRERRLRELVAIVLNIRELGLME